MTKTVVDGDLRRATLRPRRAFNEMSPTESDPFTRATWRADRRAAGATGEWAFVVSAAPSRQPQPRRIADPSPQNLLLPPVPGTAPGARPSRLPSRPLSNARRATHPWTPSPTPAPHRYCARLLGWATLYLRYALHAGTRTATTTAVDMKVTPSPSFPARPVTFPSTRSRWAWSR